jgi:replicative DNA helicase
VPTSLHAEAYGHLVEETAIRRRMLMLPTRSPSWLTRRRPGIDTVMDEAEKSIFGISERRMTRDLQPIQQVLSDYYDRVDQLSKRGDEIFGVPTGLIDLDRLLGGLQPSDLLIIAGRPGYGEDRLHALGAKNAAQIAQEACRHLLAGNVERAAGAAPDRPGDRDRLAPPAHRAS